METGIQFANIFGKRVTKVDLVLATNDTLGYDIPRVMGITEDDIMYYVLLVIGLIPVASIL